MTVLPFMVSRYFGCFLIIFLLPGSSALLDYLLIYFSLKNFCLVSNLTLHKNWFWNIQCLVCVHIAVIYYSIVIWRNMRLEVISGCNWEVQFKDECFKCSIIFSFFELQFIFEMFEILLSKYSYLFGCSLKESICDWSVCYSLVPIGLGHYCMVISLLVIHYTFM